MVSCAADSKRMHLEVLRDPVDVSPQIGLDFDGDNVPAILGGEDAVNEDVGEGVGHDVMVTSEWANVTRE